MAIRLVHVASHYGEQYHAYNDEDLVSRLFLSNGRFTVEIPDSRMNVIYSATPEGNEAFEDNERDYYLRFAVDAIERYLRGEMVDGRFPAPNVKYDIERLQD